MSVSGRAEVRRSHLVWLLVAGLLVAGIVLGALAIATVEPPVAPFELPWPILAVLFYLAEIRVFHPRLRREGQSFSLSEVPLVLGLFLATPSSLLLAAVVGGGLGLLVHRRPVAVKLAFNSALFLLGPAAAVLVFHPLAGVPDPLDPRSWMAAFAATAVSMGIGLLAVNAVIALAQGDTDIRRALTAIRLGLGMAAANTCLALVVATMLWLAPRPA